MSKQIRIPNSATRRGALTYAKLLYWVNEPATSGFDFEGLLLRPGQTIEEAELWPADDWPEAPVVLECAGNDAPAWGHRRARLVYILWRYERETGEWRELARTSATSSEWCLVLGPIARQAVVGAIPPRPRSEILEIADQLLRAIEEVVLRRLTAGDGAAVLVRLHDLLAARAQPGLDGEGVLGIACTSMPKRKLIKRKVSRAELSRAAAILGAEGGKIGGRRRAENLTREQISAIGRMGAAARWGNRADREKAKQGRKAA